MPLKITCTHCGHLHRIPAPYPVPGSEVQCGCGVVLVISFPPDLVARIQAHGSSFADPHAPQDGADATPYRPAPTPPRSAPDQAADSGRAPAHGSQGDHKHRGGS